MDFLFYFFTFFFLKAQLLEGAIAKTLQSSLCVCVQKDPLIVLREIKLGGIISFKSQLNCFILRNMFL